MIRGSEQQRQPPSAEKNVCAHRGLTGPLRADRVAVHSSFLKDRAGGDWELGEGAHNSATGLPPLGGPGNGVGRESVSCRGGWPPAAPGRSAAGRESRVLARRGESLHQDSNRISVGDEYWLSSATSLLVGDWWSLDGGGVKLNTDTHFSTARMLKIKSNT